MSKIYHISICIVLAMALMSCHTTKNAVTGTDISTHRNQQDNNSELLKKFVCTTHTQKNIVAKIKFTAHRNGSEVSLSGSLKMRRDECIQIQLIAMGFIEAVRIEITPDYFMIIDRLNKAYVKEQYNNIEFIQKNGLSFYSLQSIFWNELFRPGINHITEQNINDFSIMAEDTRRAITLNDNAKPQTTEMAAATLTWTTEDNNITRASIQYADENTLKSHIHWQYADFTNVNGVSFPSKNMIQIKTPRVNIDAEMQLGHINDDNNWESRTTLSKKYERISLEKFIQLIRSL